MTQVSVPSFCHITDGWGFSRDRTAIFSSEGGGVWLHNSDGKYSDDGCYLRAGAFGVVGY